MGRYMFYFSNINGELFLAHCYMVDTDTVDTQMVDIFIWSTTAPCCALFQIKSS